MITQAKPYEAPAIRRSGEVVDITRTKTSGVAESGSVMLPRNGAVDLGFGL